MLGSILSALAKSVSGPVNNNVTFSSQLFTLRIISIYASSSLALHLLGIQDSFSTGKASIKKACILHSFGKGFFPLSYDGATLISTSEKRFIIFNEALNEGSK